MIAMFKLLLRAQEHPRKAHYCLQYFCPPCFFQMTLPLVAGALMHGPGLHVKWAFEDGLEFCRSLTGAAGRCFWRTVFVYFRQCSPLLILMLIVEGLFLLLVAAQAFQATKRLHSFLTVMSPSNVVPTAFALCAFTQAALFFGFVLFAILSDAMIRLMAGNDGPNADVLREGFASAGLVSQLQYEGGTWGAAGRLLLAVMCLIGSVHLYVYPLRNQQWKKLRQLPASSNRYCSAGPKKSRLAKFPLMGSL